MVYRRLALIAALFAALALACGPFQESDSPTPTLTASPAPTAVVVLPLGESSKEEAEFFLRDPETVARAHIAKRMGTRAADPRITPWIESLAEKIGASPTIYLLYTWANYPADVYPSVQQFMHGYLSYPQAFGEAAKQWLDNGPCTWPVEVQENVVAVERKIPGRLRTSITTAIHPAWMAEPANRAITLEARGQFYDDREAYLDQFRCTGGGGTTTKGSLVIWPTVPAQVATAASNPTPTPIPTAIPTPVVEILDSPRAPGLARDILVGYLAEELQEEASSANVQDIANRLAYLTGSAPLVLSMYIAEGYRFAVEDEPVFYWAFLVHPGCVGSHLSLSEDQIKAFLDDFSRRWPDVDPNTAGGLAEKGQWTDGQKQEYCKQFNDWIQAKEPN